MKTLNLSDEDYTALLHALEEYGVDSENAASESREYPIGSIYAAQATEARRLLRLLDPIVYDEER